MRVGLYCNLGRGSRERGSGRRRGLLPAIRLSNVMPQAQKCPSCGSTRVHVGRVRSLSDYLRLLRGSFPARCGECSARFTVHGPGFSSAFYARCPRCLRQDLTTWDLRHYHAALSMRIQIALGANRWRCEACRCNFVSFRGRKEKYVPPAQRTPAQDANGNAA